MKPLLPLLCITLLALCACSAQPPASSASSSEASAPSAASSGDPVSSAASSEASVSSAASSGDPVSSAVSSEASASPSSDPDLSAPALQPGTLFALGDAQAPAFPEGEPELAGPDALARWEQLLSSGEIARLDAQGMAETGGTLSAESAGELLAALQSATLAFYEEAPGNPPTGGSEAVYAYAADGTCLFSALYNGEWLTVRFGDEPLCYLFDGSDSTLSRLGGLLAS